MVEERNRQLMRALRARDAIVDTLLTLNEYRTDWKARKDLQVYLAMGRECLQTPARLIQAHERVKRLMEGISR